MKLTAQDRKIAESVEYTIQQILALENRFPETRCQPVGVLLQGGPGTGKSLTAAKLALLLKGCGTYSMNSTDEFEDGIERAGVVIVDELVTKRAGESPELERILRMISTVPYRPNYAHLELKSRLSHFPLLIATTNAKLELLNTPYHQEAIRRRFPIVYDFDHDFISYSGVKYKADFSSLISIISADLSTRKTFYFSFIRSITTI
jgi:hypothetical protein